MEAPAGAASVAAQLLAFYREPALLRPPYLHGEAPMPDGQVVFRLALGRLGPELPGLPPQGGAEVRDAALAFVRQVCLWDRATHYQVLCLEPDVDGAAIRENYHLLMALIHPDRQEAAGWPAGSAQRANEAHAVLGDPAQRALYDEQLLRARDGIVLEGSVRASAEARGPSSRHHRRRPSAVGVVRRFMVLSGVVAALFVVQAWWVGGEAPQHSLLERAVPVSSRWVRDVLPDPPRFLGAPAVAAFDAGRRLDPLEEPRRMAALGSWIPFQEPPRLSAPPAQVPASAARAHPALIAQAGDPPKPEPAAVAAAAKLAPAAASPARPVLRLAQAPSIPPRATPAAPAPAGPARDQVESLVAQLVGYYDAGDVDRLLGLYDPDKLGFWGGMRTRASFADFFGETRQRRLRMDRLAWQASGVAAQARGEATVIAEFNDGRSRIERRVPVEIDIELRDGHARITRLQLYPADQ